MRIERPRPSSRWSLSPSVDHAIVLRIVGLDDVHSVRQTPATLHGTEVPFNVGEHLRARGGREGAVHDDHRIPGVPSSAIGTATGQTPRTSFSARSTATIVLGSATPASPGSNREGSTLAS